MNDPTFPAITAVIVIQCGGSLLPHSALYFEDGGETCEHSQ